MTHLTTEEAAKRYGLSPRQLRRLAAADPRWPQPLVLGFRTYRWNAEEIDRHMLRLKRRTR